MRQYCIYGCGDEAVYFINKNKVPCCSDRYNKCRAVRSKNSSGVKASYQSGKKINYFTNKHREDTNIQKKEKVLFDLFNKGSYRSNCYLNKIIKEYNLLEYKCSECNIDSWNNKKIVLELDHKDGNSSNCKIENLKYLCPNCHSQTKTFRGRGINSGKKKISDEMLLNSLKKNKNIRQALIDVGLSPRGGNYSRASKLLITLKSP